MARFSSGGFMALTLRLFLLCFVLISGVFSPAWSETNESPLVIDVRSIGEWNQGHLNQAIHIEWHRINKRIGLHTQDKEQAIVLYCRSGVRAEKAKTLLGRMGYHNVINAGEIQDAQQRLGGEIVQ